MKRALLCWFCPAGLQKGKEEDVLRVMKIFNEGVREIVFNKENICFKFYYITLTNTHLFSHLFSNQFAGELALCKRANELLLFLFLPYFIPASALSFYGAN